MSNRSRARVSPVLGFVAFVLWTTACSGNKEQPAQRRTDEASIAEERRVSKVVPAEWGAIARAELQRGAGREQLVRLSRAGDSAIRARAIRGLGRVGDEAAIARLVELLGDGDSAIRGAAVAALGLADATDSAARIAALYADQKTDTERVGIVDTLGRLGGANELLVLVDALGSSSAELEAAAAVALGLMGRRKVVLSELARAALLAQRAHPDAAVRYGVAYALWREHAPTERSETNRALAALSRDTNAEVRVAALAGQVARGSHEPGIWSAALAGDPDWRAKIHALRGMTGAGATSKTRATVAEWLSTQWPLLLGDKNAPRLRRDPARSGRLVRAARPRHRAAGARGVRHAQSNTWWVARSPWLETYPGAGSHSRCGSLLGSGGPGPSGCSAR